LRFLDVFLLYCLTQPSPDDTPREIAAMARNQQRVAERGREPGLELERDEKPIGLAVWGEEIVKALAPIATALDAAHGSADYSASLATAVQGLREPDTLPSARVLRAIEKSAEGSFASFIQAQSLQIKTTELSQALTAFELAHFQKLADISHIDQARKEAADSMSFEQYLQQYLSPDRLGIPAAR
jgi:glutamate--cysteine ligase